MLNVTTGRAAIPIFWKIVNRWPTPRELVDGTSSVYIRTIGIWFYFAMNDFLRLLATADVHFQRRWTSLWSYFALWAFTTNEQSGSKSFHNATWTIHRDTLAIVEERKCRQPRRVLALVKRGCGLALAPARLTPIPRYLTSKASARTRSIRFEYFVIARSNRKQTQLRCGSK